jgi:hypothetical protein
MTPDQQFHGLVSGLAYVPEGALALQNAAKLCIQLSSITPNRLKKRVLLSLCEFHSGPKRATGVPREQRNGGGVPPVVVGAGSQFEV